MQRASLMEDANVREKGSHDLTRDISIFVATNSSHETSVLLANVENRDLRCLSW